MASYTELREEDAMNKVSADNAAQMNKNAQRQQEIEGAQKEQVGQMAQREQMMNFQEFLANSMQPNQALGAVQAEGIARANQMNQMRSGSPALNAFADAQRVAQVRDVQAMQDEADMLSLAEAQGGYDVGAAEANMQAEYENEQAMARGLPSANDPAMQNQDALARYMAAKGM